MSGDRNVGPSTIDGVVAVDADSIVTLGEVHGDGIDAETVDDDRGVGKEGSRGGKSRVMQVGISGWR